MYKLTIEAQAVATAALIKAQIEARLTGKEVIPQEEYDLRLKSYAYDYITEYWADPRN